MTQHVTEVTTDNSVLDLIPSRDANLVDNVQVNGNFHTSDHKFLSYSLNKQRRLRIELRSDMITTE